MVHLTDQEAKIVHSVWGKLDHAHLGEDGLTRLLVTYPWTQRYFSSFGNIGSADAICHNAKVLAHGAKVLASIGEGFSHLDNLAGHYAKLSKHHSQTLHVDPANFKLFANVLVVVLALHLHEEFTPEVHNAFQKAFCAVADALSKCYV